MHVLLFPASPTAVQQDYSPLVDSSTIGSAQVMGEFFVGSFQSSSAPAR